MLAKHPPHVLHQVCATLCASDNLIIMLLTLTWLMVVGVVIRPSFSPLNAGLPCRCKTCPDKTISSLTLTLRKPADHYSSQCAACIVDDIAQPGMVSRACERVWTQHLVQL